MAYSTNPYVIAAICGNFYQESKVNPGAWEGYTWGNPGYGLGQWTDNPPVVLRRTALFNWLSAHNYPIDSGQGQLEFLIAEDIWLPQNPNFPYSDYPTLTDYLQSTSTDLAALVKEFMWHWEGIDDGSYNTRYSWASQMLLIFQSTLAQREPWIAVNSQISDTQATWNSLNVYDFFMGTTPTPPGPDPPTPPTPVPPYHRTRKGLPPWLIYKLTKGEF